MRLILIACVWMLAAPGGAEYQQAFKALMANDHERLVEQARRGAELGHPGAMRLLADAYSLGQGVPEDHAEALKWYRRAAEHGDKNGVLAKRVKEELEKVGRSGGREAGRTQPGQGEEPEAAPEPVAVRVVEPEPVAAPVAKPEPVKKVPVRQESALSAWYNGRPKKRPAAEQAVPTGRVFQKYGENGAYYQVARFEGGTYTLKKYAPSAGGGYHLEQARASESTLKSSYRAASLPDFCERCGGRGQLGYNDKLESAGMGTTYVSEGSSGVYATKNYKYTQRYENCPDCRGRGIR